MAQEKPSRRQALMAGAMAAGAGAMFGFARTASAATDESEWVGGVLRQPKSSKGSP